MYIFVFTYSFFLARCVGHEEQQDPEGGQSEYANEHENFFRMYVS